MSPFFAGMRAAGVRDLKRYGKPISSNHRKASDIRAAVRYSMHLMGAPATSPSGFEMLMFAIGSGGDVHPMIGIGQALRSRGHRVVIATNSYFEGAVRRAGLDFVSTSSEEDYLRVIQDPDLWQLGKGFRVLFRVMLDGMRKQYEMIGERYQSGRTLVIAPSSALGARIANERLGVPLVNLHLQPLVLRSLSAEHGLAASPVLRKLVPSFRKAFFAALDRWVLDPPLVPELNQFRAEMGLPPVRRVLDAWGQSPHRVIGLWPDWFATPQLGWPAQLRLTGFPLFDESGTRELPAGVEEFLAEGDSPIVFTAGTAMRFAEKFFVASAEACRNLGRRGILLTHFREQVPSQLPDGIRHFEYIPFSFLLPRCAVLVHHGGIGTIAQALRAGVPQLITPMNFDQPSNADRVRMLGVGESLRPREYTAKTARAKLEKLLSHPDIKRKCQDIAGRFQTADPVQQTCDLIEEVATQGVGSVRAAII